MKEAVEGEEEEEEGGGGGEEKRVEEVDDGGGEGGGGGGGGRRRAGGGGSLVYTFPYATIRNIRQNICDQFFFHKEVKSNSSII